jgi:hypothetical protein
MLDTKDVPIHSNVETVADRDLDRGLDVQVAAPDVRAQLGDICPPTALRAVSAGDG